jgi:hypothetical protein
MDSDTSTAMTSSRSAAVWASTGPSSNQAAHVSDAHSATARQEAGTTEAGTTSLPDTRTGKRWPPTAERRHLSRSQELVKFSTALPILCPVVQPPETCRGPRWGARGVRASCSRVFAADERVAIARVCPGKPRELFYRPGEEPRQAQGTARPHPTAAPQFGSCAAHVRLMWPLMPAAAGRPTPRPCRPDLRPRACDRGEGSAGLERPE